MAQRAGVKARFILLNSRSLGSMDLAGKKNGNTNGKYMAMAFPSLWKSAHRPAPGAVVGSRLGSAAGHRR